MILTILLLQNSLERVLFYKEIFLLIDTNIEVVLRMFFLFFNSTNFQFNIKELIQRFYITIKALPITKRVEIIDKYKFVKVALNKYFNTFVIYITVIKLLIAIYLR